MPETDAAMGHLLLVAGAGRSGTSLFTGLVGRLGYHIPVPEVTADATNPRGFGEPRWAVDFHNALLRRLNVSTEDGRPEAWQHTAEAADDDQARARLRGWLQEQLAAADRVVVKDPRAGWFLPLHARVADDLGVRLSVATMLRHPAASVRSRELAYGTGRSATARTAAWVNMMLGTERATRGLPRAVVAYDGLMADWEAALRRAEPALGVPLVSAASAERRAEAGRLVDGSLRRAAAEWDDLGLPAALVALAERVHAALGALAEDPSAAGATAELDALREEYLAMYTDAAELTVSRVGAARVAERRRVRARAAAEQGPVRSAGPRPRLLRRLLRRG